MLSIHDRIQLPATHIPGFRTSLAVQNGVEKNLLFRTWGGLGDQICAEPTLRFALKTFKGCTISLASENPEFFTHLKFDKVYDLRKEKPDYNKYLLLDTITPPDESNLVWQFFGHMITNCVDFPSLCALRCQLPVVDREIKLQGVEPKDQSVVEKEKELQGKLVYVHAGKHWPSKTFPKDWWDKVIETLVSAGKVPVLIGANADDNRGTVDVTNEGCWDLRNKLSIMETVWLLERAKVLMTNDSSPLHMAVSGNAWIHYIATCKHPDFISHWRKGQWNWRMQNHGLSGFWDVMDYCPNKENQINVDEIEESLLRSWLPDPAAFAKAAIENLNEV